MRKRKLSPLGYARRISDEVMAHPSNAARPRRALARAIGWQVRKRVIRRPVDVDFFGMVLRCHPSSQSASNIWYFTSRYDHHEMAFLERYLRAGDAVIDAGANIGTYTLLAAAQIGSAGHIDAFEPDPVNVERLRENVRLNHLEDVVTVHAVAVSAEAGPVEFYADFDVSNAILRPGRRAAPTRTVGCVVLDDVVACGGPLALGKLDVEGAEVDALRGATRILQSGRPAVWLIEALENQLAKFDTSWAELSALMADHGYRPARFDADRSQLRNDESYPRGNCLFVAETHRAEVEARLAGSESTSSNQPVG